MLYVIQLGQQGPAPEERGRALDAATHAGLSVISKKSGHRWGYITRACGSKLAVWGTPRNPDDHGKQIARFVAKHQDHEAPDLQAEEQAEDK